MQTTGAGAGRLRSLSGTLVRILASGGLLLFVLSGVDWAELRSRLSKLQPETVLIVVCLNLSAHFLMVARWRLSLDALRLRVPFAELSRCYWVGAYYNLFLPSSVGGDAARAYGLYRLTHRPQLAATSSLLDRIAGLAALLALALVAALALGPGPLTDLVRVGLGALLLGFVATSFAISARLGRWLRRRARGRRWLRLGISSLHFAVRILRIRPWLGLGAIVWTAGYYLCVAYSHRLLASDLGIEAPLPLLMVNIPLIALGSMLPISINGIGLREALYLGLFLPAGWSREAVLATSWVIFATVLAAGLPGFCLEATGRGASFRARS